jgi:hypothetical protein
VPIRAHEVRSLGTQITEVYGHRWQLVLLWYVEVCIAGAAIWALTDGGRPRALLAALAYLLLCGAALAVPAHALRLLLTVLPVSPAHRLLALQLFLGFAAAATSATLSSEEGWAAIICILLIGDALWALELELRVKAAADAHGA